MGIYLPRRWKQQPNAAVEIDWSHPLSRGLALYTLGRASGAYDVVGGAVAAPIGSSGIAVNKSGYAVESNSNTAGGWYLNYRSDLVRQITTDFTLALDYYVASSASGGHIFAMPFAAGTYVTPTAAIKFRRSSTSADGVLEIADSTSSAKLVVYNASFVVNEQSLLTISKSGAATSCYRNGASLTKGTDQFSSGSTVNFGVPTSACFLNRSDSLTGFGATGSIALTALWSRALTDGEHRAFYENPYQILRPTASRRYSFGTLSGAPPSYSASIAGRLPKLNGSVAVTRSIPDRTASTAGRIPSLKGAASATRSVPDRNATVQAGLPKLSGATTATMTIPGRSAAISGRLPKLSGTASTSYGAVNSSATISARIPNLSGAASAIYGAASTSAAVNGRLPLLRGSASASRAIPGRIANVTATLPRLSGLSTATRTAPDVTGGIFVDLPKLTGSVVAYSAVPIFVGGVAASLPKLSGTVTGEITEPVFYVSADGTLPMLQGRALVSVISPSAADVVGKIWLTGKVVTEIYLSGKVDS